MISLLSEILCAIESLAAAIVNTLILSVNGLILLLGVTLEAVLATLPAMPEPLEAPDDGVLELINWLIPLAPLFAFCTTTLVMWAGFMGVKILLNWLRAF